MLNFTSCLATDYTEPLEKLLFFNPGQDRAYSAIVDSLDLFGAPAIYCDNDKLRVKVEKREDVQSLFALEGEKLVGAMVYSRVSYEHIAVIHIVVDQDYSSHGRYAHKMLVVRMLELLRKNMRHIKGIDAICLLNGNNKIREIPV